MRPKRRRDPSVCGSPPSTRSPLALSAKHAERSPLYVDALPPATSTQQKRNTYLRLCLGSSFPRFDSTYSSSNWFACSHCAAVKIRLLKNHPRHARLELPTIYLCAIWTTYYESTCSTLSPPPRCDLLLYVDTEHNIEVHNGESERAILL